MEQIIDITLKKDMDDSYQIVVSSGINISGEVKKLNLNNNFALITDDLVYKLYNDKINENLKKENLNYKVFIFKNGEKRKNLLTFKKISEEMLKEGFDRRSTIIAFGGGVVGDMAGYVAGTYMRGIPFIQIPTTLLAQVDSSIGGKVAVDLKNGKNSSGLFYQPKKVFIDIDYLNTLSDDEFNNGMIEIIKHGIILDKDYFGFIEGNLANIKDRDKKTLISLIQESCKIKADVVQRDEKENDLRRILNFGHSVGHAIETVSNFKLKHGYAVGLGIIKEAEISNKLGYLGNNDLERIKSIVYSFGVEGKTYNKKKILNILKHDKKNVKKGNSEISVPIVLPIKIGEVKIQNFTLDEVEEYL